MFENLKNNSAPIVEAEPNTDDTGFFAEFSEPVQPFPKPEEDPEPETVEPLAPLVDQKTLESIARQNKNLSEIIVKAGDTLIAWLISAKLSKTDDLERYKASQDSITDMVQCLSEMMPTNSAVLPPWAGLAITIVAAYTPAVQTALQDRKIAAMEKEKEELANQLERMKAENKLREETERNKLALARLKKQERKLQRKSKTVHNEENQINSDNRNERDGQNNPESAAY